MKAATLTLNPCIDKTLYFSKSFTAGSLNRSSYAMMNAGGKGINVARLLRRLGVDAEVLGFAGGRSGAVLAHMLGTDDIDCGFVETKAETRFCMKFIDADGVCTEANEPGGPITDEEYGKLQKSIADFAFACCEAGEEGIIFAGGSIPDGIPATAYKDLFETFRNFPLRFILDADGDALRFGLQAHPWLIKPNEHELASLVGYEPSGRDAEARAISAAKASRRIHAEYGTSVLCTLGADGAVFTGDEGSVYVNAPHVTLKGFTGAGDTFLASFMFAYEKNGRDVSSALCFASSAAAAKVELTGTDMPNKAQMMKFLEKVEAKRLDI